MIGGLATDGAGNTLTAFHRLPESARFDDAPLTAALVVLTRGGRVLMVFNRFRRCWELPGGMIDSGETPRRAAARELREETGQDAAKLEFAGFARFLLAEPRRVEYLALYSAEVGSARPFTPNHEIAAIQWWDGVRPLAGRVQLLDVTLARLSGRDLGP